MSGLRRPRIAELVLRAWSVPESSPLDVARFEALMRDAVTAGLVRTWDDGRGRAPWYQARRGPEERALLARCVEALRMKPSETRV